MAEEVTPDKIYFEFDDVFLQVKKRTELKARGILDENMRKNMVLSEPEKEIVAEFFNEGVADIQNKALSFKRLQNYDGVIIYTATDLETENLFKKAKPLIEKCFIHYLLWAWYDSVSLFDLASLEREKYNQYLKDLQNTSTKKMFVQPKWRPNF